MSSKRKYRDRAVDGISAARPAAPAAVAEPPAAGEPSPLQQRIAEAQRAEQYAAPPAPEKTVEQLIDELGASDAKKTFLREHPRFVGDLEPLARFAYRRAIAAGITDDTPELFDAIERDVDSMLRGAATVPTETNVRIRTTPPPAPPPRRSPPVSAPISREAPSYSGSPAKRGQVQLSAAQREAARIAGVDEFTYAKNLTELERRKAAGMYPDG